MDDIEDILKKAATPPPKGTTPAVDFTRLCKCKHTFQYHYHCEGFNYVGGACRWPDCTCKMFKEI